MKNEFLNYYLNTLNGKDIPEFLKKYLKTPSLIRLKKVGYFCGMDFASKDIYNFAENISRYDHSLTVALLVYKITKDKKQTLAGLFHDIATPCFSHVIDYMNKDYEKQESTELYTEKILREDTYLLDCLKEDKIEIEDIINFKKYTIVDNKRPKVCADRIDGVILTAIGWTKDIKKKEILEIVNNLSLYKNENNELEIGFADLQIANKVLKKSQNIDKFCHSNEDNYMMQLLAKITKIAITKGFITYIDLYYLNELEIFDILENISDEEIKRYLIEFKTIKIEEIPKINLPNIKARDLNPLVQGIRLKELK